MADAHDYWPLNLTRSEMRSLMTLIKASLYDHGDVNLINILAKLKKVYENATP